MVPGGIAPEGGTGPRSAGRRGYLIAQACKRKARAVPENLGYGRGVLRTAKVIALNCITVILFEKGRLAFGFDSFGNRVHVKGSRHCDDRICDRCIIDVCRYVVNERSVDLDDVDRKAPQMAQARVTGSKIVERERNSDVLELP